MMAHYRKIDSRIQNDEKFCSLSDDGQLVFLLILTHPHLTALGAMRGSVAGLAAEKRWPEKRYRKAFQESAAMGMVKYDEKSSFIWLPNFLKYNHPESPNVVRSWASSLELLPECSMKHQLCRMVKAFVKDLPKAFDEALAKVFDKELPEDFCKDLPKSMPNQEQEQKHKQKQEHSLALGIADYPQAGEMSEEDDESHEPDVPEPEKIRTVWPASKTFPDDFPQAPPAWFLEWATEACPQTNVQEQWLLMLDHEFRDKHTEWWRAARRWMRKAPEFQSNGARASPDRKAQRDAEMQDWAKHKREREEARKAREASP